MTDALRLAPTSAHKAPPPEFRDLFVRYGWRRVEHLFGKNPAKRYAAELGSDALAAERATYVARGRGTRPASTTPAPERIEA